MIETTITHKMTCDRCQKVVDKLFPTYTTSQQSDYQSSSSYCNHVLCFELCFECNSEIAIFVFGTGGQATNQSKENTE